MVECFNKKHSGFQRRQHCWKRAWHFLRKMTRLCRMYELRIIYRFFNIWISYDQVCFRLSSQPPKHTVGKMSSGSPCRRSVVLCGVICFILIGQHAYMLEHQKRHSFVRVGDMTWMNNGAETAMLRLRITGHPSAAEEGVSCVMHFIA